MPARGYEFYLRVFKSISRRYIDLNTRKLKVVSTSGHVIFCLIIDIDAIPGQRFLGLIFYSLNQSTCEKQKKTHLTHNVLFVSELEKI